MDVRTEERVSLQPRWWGEALLTPGHPGVRVRNVQFMFVVFSFPDCYRMTPWACTLRLKAAFEGWLSHAHSLSLSIYPSLSRYIYIYLSLYLSLAPFPKRSIREKEAKHKERLRDRKTQRNKETDGRTSGLTD